MAIINIGKSLKRLNPEQLSSKPDWVQADPKFIEHALSRALTRSGHGWYVALPSSDLGKKPKKVMIDGAEVALWRASGAVHAAPAECPHMGADLSCGHVKDDALVCPWHGLAVKQTKGSGLFAHDDGLLIWVQSPHAENTAPLPEFTRPTSFLSGVIQMEAKCEPEDIVANRLDPWHGTHYHPHSFARLQLTDKDPDCIALRVAYRVAGALCVEVDCTFHAPTKRSIVMTITGGDGKGSVVETHATPMSDGRTMVTEATLATSDRNGFSTIKPLSRLIRPMIEKRAARLWVEDVEYAERRYELRTRGDKKRSAKRRNPLKSAVAARKHLRTIK